MEVGEGAENAKLLIKTSPHQGAAEDLMTAQSHLSRTKGAPSALIALEITRVLGALCQELGAETKIYFFFHKK